MIIWLNGTFGAGKTSTANAITEIRPEAALIDPELIGELIEPALGADDFQDLPLWRELVVTSLSRLVEHGAGPLVVPMTLLEQDYASEIFTGLGARGVRVHHVLLHARRDELQRRIMLADPEEPDQVRLPRQRWRLDHLDEYSHALPWLRRSAALVVDTTLLDARRAARLVLGTADFSRG